MMMNTLSPRLIEIVQDHLQAEESYLQKLKTLAEKLLVNAGQVPQLADHQSELSGLVGEMLELQIRRNAIKDAASKLSGIPSQNFSLSKIQFDSQESHSAFQRRREELHQLAIETHACVRTAEVTLKGWSGIVNYVLGELAGGSGQSDRYNAVGQRLTSIPSYSVDVRS